MTSDELLPFDKGEFRISKRSQSLSTTAWPMTMF